jgi:hypothetical protein
MRARVISAVTSLLLAVAPLGAQSVDHSSFDALLRRHVQDGLVDYDAFKAAPAFAAYLRALDATRPDALPAAERLAFWINVYNAYTIELINRHGERQSIRNINRTFGLGKGPWREELVRAGGRTYHLDNVEHDIVRKQFQEPRIHFALVCAARGCPPLRAEAYTGARLEQQLEDQARRFLTRSPDRNRVDLATGTLHLSPIVGDWYRADFGGSDAAIGRFVARYLPPGPERELLLGGRFRIASSDYDWSLNVRRPSR